MSNGMLRMSATFAYRPNDEGVCYTFTSCEEADRRMYQNLTDVTDYRHGLRLS